MSTVQKTMHAVDGERLSVYEVKPRDSAAGQLGVVIMHGAGTGNKERNLPLAHDFASRGHVALALDFSGHGESSGSLPELSLKPAVRRIFPFFSSERASGSPAAASQRRADC